MEDMGFLGKVEARHYGIDHYAKIVDLDKYFKFTFVRNPYDRLISAVCGHALRGGEINNKTFNEFVQQHQNRLTEWIATKPQHTFIYIKGELKVDFVGNYERLKDDWAFVCNKLGKNETPTLTHSRWSHYQHPREISYNTQNKKLIREIYKKDFKLFGYEDKS